VHTKLIRRLIALLTAIAASAAVPAATRHPSERTPSPRPIHPAGYAKLLSEHKGRALVVNMWATWCEPCREEFPELVKLHREASRRGVDLVAISLDLPASLDSEVIPFLEKQQVTFATYIKDPGNDEVFINTVDGSWSGALPATFVYDRSGRMVQRISGVTTFKKLMEILEPLLTPP